MALKSSRWLNAFETFVKDIRISSKEEIALDDRGSEFVLWDSQKRFLKEVGEGLDRGVHKFNCLKSRQVGITTLGIALVDVFWPAMHPGIIGCLVTDDEKKRESNRSLIVKYVESFPDGYFGDKFRIVGNNRSSLKFSNGSRIDLLVAGTKKKSIGWAEGVGYAFGHLTEVSNYGDVEGLKSLEEGFAQQNPHRLFVYESTAKGYNHWHERYVAGKRNYLTECSFFLGWWTNPTNSIQRSDPLFSVYGKLPPVQEEKELISEVARIYGHKITMEQLAWFRFKEQDAGAERDLLDQNQPWTEQQAFVQTGYSFFQTRQINKDIQKIKDAGVTYKAYEYDVGSDFYNFSMRELKPGEDSPDQIELKVWEEPKENGRYVIGCDGAYGRNDHKDGNAIVVFRCFADRMVQVAEYVTNHHDPKHVAWILFHLCAAYRDCMVNVEVGGPCKIMMLEFDHLRQLLASEWKANQTKAKGWEDAAANARWYLYHRPDSTGAGYMYNFETNYRTKGPLMHGMRSSYLCGEIEAKSIKLLNEMSIVIYNDGEIAAPESRDPDKKDDRVFATAFAHLAWVDWIRKSMIAEGLSYERVMELESGEKSPVGRQIDNIVYGFLKRKQDEADEAEDRPHQSWLSDQGLQ